MGNFDYPTVMPYSFYRRQVTNGVVSITTNNGVAPISTSTRKSGSSVQNYQKRIAQGLDASSSYTRRGFPILVPMTVSMRSHQNSGGLDVDSVVKLQNNYGLPILSYNNANASNEASAILKRKLRNFTGQSNQLTNVAELRDLPKSIRAVAGSATKLVTTVLNSKRRGTDLRKFASDQWLTWSFGVLPTLGAVDDALKSYNSYVNRKDHKIKEFGFSKTDWLSQTDLTSGGSHHYNLRHRGSFRHELSVKITAGYKFQLASDRGYDLGEHLGFNIRSVVPTLYELLPYSWLLDYFTTAGSFIEDAFSADFGNSIYICQSTIFRVKGEVKTQPVALTSTPLLYFYNTPLKLEFFEFTRSPLTQLPRAPLRFKTSDEVAHNAVNKLLNLTALLGSKR